MEKIVVTTGQPFTDIDSLACTIAYVELLRKEGRDAEAVLPGPLNKSVTKEIKSWKFKYSKKPSTPSAKYVLVDISESKFFASFVKEKDVIEVFDHRFGFEKYWSDKLGKGSHIEMVGACATLIWEEFEKRIHPVTISETSASLLLTAITSNTLNFKASVTTPRDKNAYEKLKDLTTLPANWIESYFKEQEEEAYKNPEKALLNDTKGTGEMGKEIAIGQLEFWDSRRFLNDHLKVIQKTLESYGKENWFFTSPSISQGKNYIFTKNIEMKRFLESCIGVKFNGDIGVTQKLWLRKEIIKELQSKKITL